MQFLIAEFYMKSFSLRRPVAPVARKRFLCDADGVDGAAGGLKFHLAKLCCPN